MTVRIQQRSRHKLKEKNMKVPLEEQETTINLFPRQVEKCSVYSSEFSVKNKMRKYAEKYPEFVIDKEDEFGIFATVPRDWFKIRPPRRLTMTPEQKEIVAERTRHARSFKTT